jgi:hypothetical protein
MTSDPPSRTRQLIAGSAALALVVLMLAAIPSLYFDTAATATPLAPAVSRAGPATRWPPVDWWDWGINRVLTPAERGLLAATGCDTLFALSGAIYQVGNEPVWTPQGRPGAAGSGLPIHLVVRIDSDFGKNLDPTRSATLVPILVAGFLRNRTDQTIGLQLDCDVPTKRLPTYAEFLHQLRAQLPADVQLSVTMLLDWTHSKDLPMLAKEVDFLMPQAYSALAPFTSADTAVTLAGNLSAALARLERAGVPYRLGLPTFEQCSLFGAKGDLIRTTIPVSPEAAIIAGGLINRVTRSDETTIEMMFTKSALLGGVVIAPGSHLLFGGLSATGLEHTLAVLRAQKTTHCLGVCLFHLPGMEVTRSLSISQVTAAHAGTVSPAAVTARLMPQGKGRWTVILSNRGDEDWFNVAEPAHIILEADRTGIRPGSQSPNPGLIRMSSTHQASTARGGVSTSCIIDVGVLRAGDVVTIADLSTEPGSTPKGIVWCAGRSYPVESTSP